MNFLNESLIENYFLLYVCDFIVLFLTVLAFLFIMLELIFTEGKFRFEIMHLYTYYVVMFISGYHFGRYVFI